jgi:hypothetical protein
MVERDLGFFIHPCADVGDASLSNFASDGGGLTVEPAVALAEGEAADG